MKQQCRVRITGKVQGVSFRASTKKRAQELGIAGHVKNLPDGRVEAIFQGNPPAIEKMVSWCNIGPRLAQVEHVEVEWQELRERKNSFRVL